MAKPRSSHVVIEAGMYLSEDELQMVMNNPHAMYSPLRDILLSSLAILMRLSQLRSFIKNDLLLEKLALEVAELEEKEKKSSSTANIDDIRMYIPPGTKADPLLVQKIEVLSLVLVAEVQAQNDLVKKIVQKQKHMAEVTFGALGVNAGLSLRSTSKAEPPVTYDNLALILWGSVKSFYDELEDGAKTLLFDLSSLQLISKGALDTSTVEDNKHQLLKLQEKKVDKDVLFNKHPELKNNCIKLMEKHCHNTNKAFEDQAFVGSFDDDLCQYFSLCAQSHFLKDSINKAQSMMNSLLWEVPDRAREFSTAAKAEPTQMAVKVQQLFDKAVGGLKMTDQNMPDWNAHIAQTREDKPGPSTPRHGGP